MTAMNKKEMPGPAWWPKLDMAVIFLGLLHLLGRLNRPSKRILVFLIDFGLCVVSAFAAYSLRLGVWTLDEPAVLKLVGISFAAFLPIFALFGVYSSIFRFAGRGMMQILLKAGIVYSLVVSSIAMSGVFEGVPRTVGIIQSLLFIGLVVFARLLTRYLLVDLLGKAGFDGETRNLVIYGAGSAGQQAASAASFDPALRIIGFVDDDRRLHGQRLDGLPVHHSDALARLTEAEDVTDILLAMPNLSRKRRHEIVHQLEALKLRVKTLPPLKDIVDGRVSLNDIRDLDVEDLLGRDPVAPNELLLGRTVVGKTVMITGAGGSIGSELCRQILAIGAARLVLFEMSEHALYTIERELRETLAVSGKAVEVIPILASVRDERKVLEALCRFEVDSIYHAAAYKHVPLVESNPVEGVRNNVLGTLAVVESAQKAGVSDVILVSTDKAVRPTNVMGASKRAAELIVQAYAELHDGTRFSMVRFGNVLGSSGSVVPLFRSQIASGGPITLTHREVTRFFMTIPEAAQLVIQAGGLARGGEVFVLDMGQSVRISDLARSMVHLSGLTLRDERNPDGDIAIEEIGLRPGEKLYEELLIGDNPQPTKHPRIMMAHESTQPLDRLLEAVRIFEESDDPADFRQTLAAIVPEYQEQQRGIADTANPGVS